RRKPTHYRPFRPCGHSATTGCGRSCKPRRKTRAKAPAALRRTSATGRRSEQAPRCRVNPASKQVPPRWHRELRGRLHPMSATAIRSLYQKLRLYLFNTSWMMAERLLNIGVGFAVAILLARYLGPERFGILSYAISVTAIFASAGHMGLAGLVVREVVREPHEVPKILGTTFML